MTLHVVLACVAANWVFGLFVWSACDTHGDLLAWAKTSPLHPAIASLVILSCWPAAIWYRFRGNS